MQLNFLLYAAKKKSLTFDKNYVLMLYCVQNQYARSYIAYCHVQFIYNTRLKVLVSCVNLKIGSLYIAFKAFRRIKWKILKSEKIM